MVENKNRGREEEEREREGRKVTGGIERDAFVVHEELWLSHSGETSTNGSGGDRSSNQHNTSGHIHYNIPLAYTKPKLITSKRKGKDKGTKGDKEKWRKNKKNNTLNADRLKDGRTELGNDVRCDVVVEVTHILDAHSWHYLM